MNHQQIQQEVATLFSRIGGEDIGCFRSSLGTSYVACKRNGLEFLFSVQTRENRSHFILTRSDLDENGYLLVGSDLSDITDELEKLANNPNYIIVRNAGAVQLQIAHNIMYGTHK